MKTTQEQRETTIKITKVIEFEKNTKEYINSLHPSFATSNIYVLIMNEKITNNEGIRIKQIPVITNGKQSFEIGSEFIFLKMKYQTIEPTPELNEVITKMFF